MKYSDSLLWKTLVRCYLTPFIGVAYLGAGAFLFGAIADTNKSLDQCATVSRALAELSRAELRVSLKGATNLKMSSAQLTLCSRWNVEEKE